VGPRPAHQHAVPSPKPSSCHGGGAGRGGWPAPLVGSCVVRCEDIGAEWSRSRCLGQCPGGCGRGSGIYRGRRYPRVGVTRATSHPCAAYFCHPPSPQAGREVRLLCFMHAVVLTWGSLVCACLTAFASSVSHPVCVCVCLCACPVSRRAAHLALTAMCSRRLPTVGRGSRRWCSFSGPRTPRCPCPPSRCPHLAQSKPSVPQVRTHGAHRRAANDFMRPVADDRCCWQPASD
jgi:hypothetical protein